jgi:hypothetical protein
MRKFYSAFLILNFSFLISSFSQTLDSTNLPIVFINTNFQSIPDEPKVIADMAILDNGYNVMNHVTDTNYTYYGKIGIEQRGSISQQWWWWQKSYSLETQNAQGLDTNVKLFGMPKESDWVLYGPFNEATLMKNVLTYQLVRELGYYVTRTKYCEMMLKTGWFWGYNGIYVAMEKIKRDKNRVDISKLDADDNAGDSLTGGYIFAVDRNINVQDSCWPSKKDTALKFTYKYPKAADITPQQKNYIQQFVDSFETVLQGPNFANLTTGYRNYIEPVSFMDFFFLQEISKNIDAYKRSAYLYKDKNSKDRRIHAGPHWDYNSAYDVGVGGCESFDSDTGWVYNMSCWIHGANYPVPFWWKRFLQDTVYTRDLKCRWMQLRATTFSNAHIFYLMDSIASYISTASTRHYQKFSIAGTLQNYEDSLKNWITARMAWLDANMPGNCWNMDVADVSLENSFSVYPNPTRGILNVSINRYEDAQVILYNMYGERIYQHPCSSTYQTIDLSSQPNGMYFIHILTKNEEISKKILVNR